MHMKEIVIIITRKNSTKKSKAKNSKNQKIENQ